MKKINLSLINGGVTWIEKTDSCSTRSTKMMMGDHELALSTMLRERENYPKEVRRQNIFYCCTILDFESLVIDAKKWESLDIKIGDFYENHFLITEFALSDFKTFFLTDEQYLSWENEISETVLQFAQSIESFFLNPNTTLNYSLLVKSVEEMILSGVTNPIQYLLEKTSEKMHRQPYFARYQAALE